MTHPIHIANLLALRPTCRGRALLALAYRPSRGDRKEFVPTID